jgi:hypothetical protein
METSACSGFLSTALVGQNHNRIRKNFFASVTSRDIGLCELEIASLNISTEQQS